MNKRKISIIVISIVAVFIVSIVAFSIINNKPKNYEIKFQTKSDVVIQTQTIERGKKATKPQDPTREGYKFIEWQVDGKKYDFTQEITEDITLVAKWEKEKEDVESFVVKFNSVGGTTISNQIVEKGNKVEKPEEPKKEGYKFIEWQFDSKKYDFELEVISNLELVAIYEEIKTNNNTDNNNTDNNNQSSSIGNNNSTSSELKLTVPTLVSDGTGITPEENGKIYKVTNVDFAEGIEIYKSTDGKNYQLEKTVTKKQLTENYQIKFNAYLGEHNYYKVRAYATSNGKKVYSSYTQIIDIVGPIG